MEKKKITLLIALAAGMPTAQTQNADSTKLVSLTEVNVVASRVEKDNFETPRSVTVITAAQILESGALSLAEVLSEAGGIYLTGTGQVPGANESIFMRGANSNQTVILLDGVRLSDASTVNNTIDLSELSLADVDRIEIIRGAHGTLYGSAAIGGVISITTKHGPKNGMQGAASFTAGTFGKKSFYHQADANLHYRLKNGLFAAGGIEKILAGGMDAASDTVTNPNVFNRRDLDQWDRLTWTASTGLDRRNLRLDFSFRETIMKTDLDKGAYQDDDNYQLEFRRKLITGILSYRFNPHFSTRLNLGYSENQRDAVNDSSIIDALGTFDHTWSQQDYRGKFTTAEWQLNSRFPHAAILAGVSYKKEEMSQEDYYYSTAFGQVFEMRTKLDTVIPAETMAGFVQLDLNGELVAKSYRRLNLVTGVRYNHNNIAGDHFTYEVNPGYKISDDALLYVSWSTGFNTPSLYQFHAPDMYIPYDGAPSSNLTRGNKDLKPEISSSLEAGFRQRVNEKITYNISFFKSVTENLIEYVYLWNNAVGADTLGNDFSRDDYRGDRYLNIGKQTTTGIELSLQATVNDKLKISANATLVSGIIEYSPSTELQKQTSSEHIQLYSNGAFLSQSTRVTGLTRRPGEANLALHFTPLKLVSIAPSVRYIGPRNDIYYDSSLGPYGALSTGTIEGVALFNISVRIIFNSHLSFNFRSENISNKKYEEIYGFTTRGRSIFASAHCLF